MDEYIYVVMHSRKLLAQSSSPSDDAPTVSQVCINIQNVYKCIWVLTLKIDMCGPEVREGERVVGEYGPSATITLRCLRLLPVPSTNHLASRCFPRVTRYICWIKGYNLGGVAYEAEVYKVH